MNARDRRCYEIARKIALKVDNGSTFFFGGILAKNGRILNLGWNKPRKTHPRSPSKWKNIHCEFDTIVNVPKDDLANSSLFVVRLAYNKTKMALAKPCKDCENFIRFLEVGKVYYSISDNEIGVWDVKRNEYDKITSQ